jgi:hypothetical protein
MTTLLDGESIRQVILGQKVVKGPLTNPQTASSALFTVAGGLVLVTGLVGIVTTVQGSTANSFNLQHTPTGGSAADLCAATVCTSDAVGTIYTMTGVAVDELSVQTAHATAEAPSVTFGLMNNRAGKGIVLPAGSMTLKASGNNTGATSWTLFYVPLDTGASVAAA